MMLAWFRASEITASSGPRIVSNNPPLASKHDGYKIVSSIPMNRLNDASNSLWIVCVPQMNRTLASPKPHSSSACFAAAMISGWSANPR